MADEREVKKTGFQAPLSFSQDNCVSETTTVPSRESFPLTLLSTHQVPSQPSTATSLQLSHPGEGWPSLQLAMQEGCLLDLPSQRLALPFLPWGRRYSEASAFHCHPGLTFGSCLVRGGARQATP